MIVAGEDTPGPKLAAQLKEVLDEVSHPFDLSKYALAADAATCLPFWEISWPWAMKYLKANPDMQADYSMLRMAGYMGRASLRTVKHRYRYILSAMKGEGYHRQTDWIRAFRATEGSAGELPELRSFA